MKIVIIGPGAIGLLLATHLARNKNNEVWLLDRLPERARKIRRDGIRVNGVSKMSLQLLATAEVKEIKSGDVFFVCVKSYDTEEAIKSVVDLMKEDSHVLTLQNGIGNIQILNDVVGEDKVIAGVTQQAATLVDTGYLRHTAKGETVIGRANKRPLGKARVVLDILNRSGFPTRSCRDINSLIWSKLIINTGINALSAITRLRNGLLLDYPEIREILRQAVSEAVRLAKRKRIKLSYDDPIQKVESVCKATSANLSSMLQDVLNKRPTEIDFINGAIVRQGRNLGIATPVNEVLTNLIKSIEKSYTKQQKEVEKWRRKE
jgi:2-dehydropantoate 2-reductase